MLTGVATDTSSKVHVAGHDTNEACGADNHRVDGNLSGYHKKKYVCKVDMRPPRFPFVACLTDAAALHLYPGMERRFWSP